MIFKDMIYINMNEIKYIKPKEASKILGVNLDTLRPFPLLPYILVF